jgi:hypothetical protein
MAILAQVRHVQRFGVVPVMALEPRVATAPGAAPGSEEEAELLSQRGRVARGARAYAPGAKCVEADIQVTVQTGEFGVETVLVPSDLLHGW